MLLLFFKYCLVIQLSLLIFNEMQIFLQQATTICERRYFLISLNLLDCPYVRTWYIFGARTEGEVAGGQVARITG